MGIQERIICILNESFHLRPEESFLVIADRTCREIGELFYETAKAVGHKASILPIEDLQYSGQEPPSEVAKAMREANVVACITAKSLTHTNARIEAAKGGTRVITMPGITLDMIEHGAASADYTHIEKLSAQLAEKLTKASKATIEKEGETLTLDITGRLGVSSPGVFREPGESGNFPSGEAFIAPLENGAWGTTIIDGSMVGIGLLASPLKASLEKGRLVSLEGEQAKELPELFATSQNATIAELGIGTNNAARLTGVILEDEKIYGTVHIAFGTNTSFGGTNKADLHYDGVILNPTLHLDEELIIDKGVFVG